MLNLCFRLLGMAVASALTVTCVALELSPIPPYSSMNLCHLPAPREAFLESVLAVMEYSHKYGTHTDGVFAALGSSFTFTYISSMSDVK